jgi:hypothetical protein
MKKTTKRKMQIKNEQRNNKNKIKMKKKPRCFEKIAFS